jgi:hypothetical protein
MRSSQNNSRLNASNISEGGFRQNILARLGNAHLDDSQVHSQKPDDAYSGEFNSKARKAEPKVQKKFLDDDEDLEGEADAYSEF